MWEVWYFWEACHDAFVFAVCFLLSLIMRYCPTLFTAIHLHSLSNCTTYERSGTKISRLCFNNNDIRRFQRLTSVDGVQKYANFLLIKYVVHMVLNLTLALEENRLISWFSFLFFGGWKFPARSLDLYLRKIAKLNKGVGTSENPTG